MEQKNVEYENSKGSTFSATKMNVSVQLAFPI